MSLTREQLLAPRRPPSREITVPELGGTLIVQGMTIRQRDEFSAALTQTKGQSAEVKIANYRVQLLARCLVDEHGRALLKPEDLELLGDIGNAMLEPAIAVAEELSGLTTLLPQAAKGN